MTTLTHWKKLRDPNYIGSWDIEQGKELVVTLVSVAKELVTGPDGKKEHCTVAKLKDHKPFILNATNAKTIAKVCGSPFIEQWVNKRITLYVTQIKAFGENVDAIRIRATAPELPTLNESHPKWQSAKQSLKDGTVTIEKIKANYKLSKEDESKLI